MFVWSNNRTGENILPEIKETGSNTVRLVWNMTNGTPAELDQLISNTIANEIIPMPELHDATGALGSVPTLVDYWLNEEMLPVILKHQKYILLNIANEAGNGSETEAAFVQTYKNAITKFRDKSVVCPLVIDAPNWGQNIDMIQSAWFDLQQHDPEHNLIFSVHTWWPNPEDSEDPGSTNRVKNELAESVQKGIPLIIGEFAPMAVGCSRSFDFETLLEECEKYGIGWMAWSWGWVDNGDCSEMDMTNNGQYGSWQDVPDFEKWGEKIVITDQNSISRTATKTDYILEYNNEAFDCELFEFTYNNVLSTTLSNPVNFYPNPFSESMEIVHKGQAKFKIYDLSGSVLESGICSETCQVGGELATGTYILELTEGNHSSRNKIIKN